MKTKSKNNGLDYNTSLAYAQEIKIWQPSVQSSTPNAPKVLFPSGLNGNDRLPHRINSAPLSSKFTLFNRAVVIIVKLVLKNAAIKTLAASEKCLLRDIPLTLHQVITPVLNYFITKHALTLITYGRGTEIRRRRGRAITCRRFRTRIRLNNVQKFEKTNGSMARTSEMSKVVPWGRTDTNIAYTSCSEPFLSRRDVKLINKPAGDKAGGFYDDETSDEVKQSIRTWNALLMTHAGQK